MLKIVLLREHPSRGPLSVWHPETLLFPDISFTLHFLTFCVTV